MSFMEEAARLNAILVDGNDLARNASLTSLPIKLIEKILLFTDVQDVLRCKRLARDMKRIIRSSSNLRQYISTTLDSRNPYLVVALEPENGDPSDELYPLIPFFKPVLGLKFITPKTNGLEKRQLPAHQRCIALRHVNPLLLQMANAPSGHEVGCLDGGWKVCEACDLNHRVFRSSTLSAGVIVPTTRLPKCVEGMLITQPPSNTATLVCYDLYEPDNALRHEILDQPQGIRLKHVLAACASLLRSERDAFRIEIQDSRPFYKGTLRLLRRIGSSGICCDRFETNDSVSLAEEELPALLAWANEWFSEDNADEWEAFMAQNAPETGDSWEDGGVVADKAGSMEDESSTGDDWGPAWEDR